MEGNHFANWAAVALQALTLVGVLINSLLIPWVHRQLAKGLSENTTDQKQGFKDTGQRYYQLSERLRVLEENMVDVKRRTERIPGGTNPGYKRPPHGKSE